MQDDAWQSSKLNFNQQDLNDENCHRPILATIRLGTCTQVEYSNQTQMGKLRSIANFNRSRDTIDLIFKFKFPIHIDSIHS
ncbi:hypothetical protein [Chamaesiphon sp.]|uniref:hypothetical protein n=1 Tax=Chamaesiphon sp. TaxID=2814140 RepID=UPI00359403CF